MGQKQFGSTQRRHILTAGDQGEVRLYIMKERMAAVHLADRGIFTRVPSPAYTGDTFKLTHEGLSAYQYLSAQRKEQEMIQSAANLYAKLTASYGTTNILARTGEHFGLNMHDASTLSDYALCVVTGRAVTVSQTNKLAQLREREGAEQYRLIYHCMIHAIRKQRGLK